jgi:transposase InsO family protein
MVARRVKQAERTQSWSAAPYRPQTNGKAERFIRITLGRLGLRRALPRFLRVRRRP